ncbi:hypothetical protein [Janibacter hoylei]|uniref:hypothetical protein n=1 Tax=Janibacter hoylei TaxID=364298 RepID=UPI0021A74B77|nr:hypothetical protein [Janibacter hoylei]MCT1618380.1 hypothetical protein [Janibacter hoylei]MCT2294484.1 hypothetical protein [Janibacter hoylei]
MDIAALSGTLPQVVALALDGWPDVAGPDGEAVATAHRLWLQGASREEVAAALGIPADRLVRQLRSGESVLEPRRLVTRDLRERFGWSLSAQSLYRRSGVVPPPDGREGPRHWWWAATIDDWAAQVELHWCQSCRHAFITSGGLKEHRTRVHG